MASTIFTIGTFERNCEAAIALNTEQTGYIQGMGVDFTAQPHLVPGHELSGIIGGFWWAASTGRLSQDAERKLGGMDAENLYALAQALREHNITTWADIKTYLNGPFMELSTESSEDSAAATVQTVKIITAKRAFMLGYAYERNRCRNTQAFVAKQPRIERIYSNHAARLARAERDIAQLADGTGFNPTKRVYYNAADLAQIHVFGPNKVSAGQLDGATTRNYHLTPAYSILNNNSSTEPNTTIEESTTVNATATATIETQCDNCRDIVPAELLHEYSGGHVCATCLADLTVENNADRLEWAIETAPVRPAAIFTKDLMVGVWTFTPEYQTAVARHIQEYCHKYNVTRIGHWGLDFEDGTHTTINASLLNAWKDMGYITVKHGGPATYGHTDYYATDTLLNLDLSTVEEQAAAATVEIETVQPQEPEQQPALPTVAFIEAAVIREAVNTVTRAAAKDMDRPVLAAVHMVLDPDGNDITVEAADGFRAARFWQYGSKVGTIYTYTKVLIPAKDFATLKSLGTKGRVRVELDTERLIWNGDAGQVITRRVTGQNYVDLNRVIPRDYTLRMEVSTADLKAAINSVKDAARKTSDIVRFIVEGDILYLQTGPDSGVTGNNQTVAAVRATVAEQLAPNNAVALNWRYVLDILNSTKEKSVELCMTPAKSGPVKIAAGNMVAVVMPMYLANGQGMSTIEPAYRPAPIGETGHPEPAAVGTQQQQEPSGLPEWVTSRPCTFCEEVFPNEQLQGYGPGYACPACLTRMQPGVVPALGCFVTTEPASEAAEPAETHTILVEAGSIEHIAARTTLTFVGSEPVTGWQQFGFKYSDLGLPSIWTAYQNALKAAVEAREAAEPVQELRSVACEAPSTKGATVTMSVKQEESTEPQPQQEKTAPTAADLEAFTDAELESELYYRMDIATNPNITTGCAEYREAVEVTLLVQAEQARRAQQQQETPARRGAKGKTHSLKLSALSSARTTSSARCKF